MLSESIAQTNRFQHRDGRGSIAGQRKAHCRAERNVGGEAEAHRTDPSAAGGRVCRDGGGRQGRRYHRGCILAQEIAPLGEFE